jgi:hypothetical protein
MWQDLILLWCFMLLPVLAGIRQWKALNQISRYFVLFCVFSLLFDLFNTYIGFVYNDNQWVFKLFLVCDLLFFFWYYHRVFEKPLWSPWVNIAFAAGLISMELLVIWQPQWNNYASWYHLMMFMYFIIQSAYAILTAFSSFENNIFLHPVFWISFGRLFYFLIIVFVFVYPKLIYKGESNEMIGLVNNYVNYFANICMYILYGVGILCLRTKK